MDSDFMGPVNIGSEEMVIEQLVDIAAYVANKKIGKNFIDGPTGVRGRNSNNDLIREKLGWDYSQSLQTGMLKLWIGSGNRIQSLTVKKLDPFPLKLLFD